MSLLKYSGMKENDVRDLLETEHQRHGSRLGHTPSSIIKCLRCLPIKVSRTDAQRFESGWSKMDMAAGEAAQLLK